MLEIQKVPKIAVIALSNALPYTMKQEIDDLCTFFQTLNLKPIRSDYLYQTETGKVHGGSAKEKADELIRFYQEDSVIAIFDVSGGDIANEVLLYMDFNKIKGYDKPFFGYSDLTTIINALYTKLNRTSYLYQVRHLLKANAKAFKETFIEHQPTLLNINYHFVQGEQMEGIVVGGNMRCFLKLVGTEFMPDLTDKLLLLESLSGDTAKMITFLTQYKQIGTFNKIKGIILGTFIQMQQNELKPTIEELVVQIVANPSMPIIKTEDIGHSINSKAIMIGKYGKFGL